MPRRPSLSHPSGLRPSVIPLTIVCGPPASGKTTYVKQHGAAVSDRNRYLHAISKPCSWPAAWFIVGAPRQKERQWWQDKLQPKDIVLLLPPEDLCYQRIKERGGVREAQQCRAVDEWFLRYGGAT